MLGALVHDTQKDIKYFIDHFSKTGNSCCNPVILRKFNK
jgi:hypothetical protein